MIPSRLYLCLAPALAAVLLPAGAVRAQARIYLSQLQNNAVVPTQFVLVDDTQDIVEAKFYLTTYGVDSLGRDKTGPEYSWAFSLPAGAQTIQVREKLANGTRKKVERRLSVGGGDPPQPTGGCIAPAPAIIGARVVNVSNSAQLAAALADAHAGDVINLADGLYEGSIKLGEKYYASFGLARSGVASAPITVQGSRNARIRAGGLGGRYGFYLRGAQHVVLRGFTVFEGSKGIVLDGSSDNVIDNVAVERIGAEGVHFRAMSSRNALRNSVVRDVGLSQAQYGEGVYIGSAVSNWATYSCDKPDASHDNVIEGNHLLRARAESVDIKEGTLRTIVRDNIFEGDQTAAPPAPAGENSADSWIDAKGNDALIENNIGRNSLNNGFEVHTINTSKWYDTHPKEPRVTWGAKNVFRHNEAHINNAAATSNPNYDSSKGYGFWLHKTDLGNVVACSNSVSGAPKGLANVSCTR